MEDVGSRGGGAQVTMCKIIIHKATLNFNHSFFYNNVTSSRVLPDLLKIPESNNIVLIACVCMASLALEWGGGGGGGGTVPPCFRHL